MHLHVDPETNERWFLDAEGELQYFNGEAIEDAFDWTPALRDGENGTSYQIEVFAADWTIDARTLCYQSGFYREVQRSGRRLLVRVRTSRGELQVGLEYPSVDAALRVFASFDRHPLEPFTRVDPYTGLTPDEIRAANDAEAALIRQGVVDRKLVYVPGRIAEADMSLAAWLLHRSRDDSKSALWHLEALPAIQARVARSDLEITLEPAATDDELARYETAIGAPLPAVLRELWTQHASAGWRLGARGQHLLSPVEAAAQRGELRASLVATAKRGAAKAWPLDALEVIAVDQDRTPTIAFNAKSQHFTTPPLHKDSYWTDSLGWMFATTINLELTQALKRKKK